MVTLVALALFVYLVEFIVLPFVIAGIIAYICTPLLDWLARRTRLERGTNQRYSFSVLRLQLRFVGGNERANVSRHVHRDAP